jgi:hypothetical protein
MNDLSRVNPGTIISLKSALPEMVRRLGTAEADLGEQMLNFDPNQEGWEDFVLAVKDQPTREKDQFSEKPFLVKYWYAEAAEILDEATGEKVKFPRLVLVDKDYETVQFGSVGAAQSWDTIRLVRGNGPWPEGLPVTFQLVQMSNNRTTWRIRLKK